MAQQAKLRTRGATAIKKAEAARPRFGKYKYLDLKEGESGIYRILLESEEWPGGEIHMGVPTRPEPPGQKNWPPRMSGLCRQDAANFKDPDTGEWDDGYGECWIHQNFKGKKDSFNKPADRTSMRCWAPAIEREEVTDPSSGAKTVRDKKGADGKPVVVIINQSWFGFFSQLSTIGLANGSVTDRDVFLRLEEKTGGQAFAQWRIIPRDKNPEEVPGTAQWDIWQEALKENKATLDDLAGVVLNMSSEAYYNRFFRADMPFEDDRDATEDPGGAEGAPAPEVSDEELEAMRSRMKTKIEQSAPQD